MPLVIGFHMSLKSAQTRKDEYWEQFFMLFQMVRLFFLINFNFCDMYIYQFDPNKTSQISITIALFKGTSQGKKEPAMWKGIEQIILKTGVRSQNFGNIFSRMHWQVESSAAAQECHLITKVTCRFLPADYYAARCEHKIEWHRNFLNEISFLADINLPRTSPTHALWACAIGG